ncbi:hypothetical protein C1H46_022104 [Malus baccata]|uniref:KIB1-4 beta-propeller domain-containing protein n=1 Tax=Malus baccata TaxID=106549 RepID=A0A540M0V5_MALBA|nr:hypothetical protein C1H46_022104 [Malus baccata]
MIIALVNSFRKEATIRLPPLELKAKDNDPRTPHESFQGLSSKGCTVADPKLNPDNYVVAALYGQVYAIGNCGHVVTLKVATLYIKSFVPSADLGFSSWVYLVESTKGDLFYVQRVRTTMRALPHMSIEFIVCKSVFHDKPVEHVEVKSIGDEAWFVDSKGSFSVVASSFLSVHQIAYTTRMDIGENGKDLLSVTWLCSI